MVFFKIYFGGIFEFIYFKKYHIFLCKLCLFLRFLLKYHSNMFLELKPTDEVTLLSPGVLFWLILERSKLQFFPFISMGARF